MAHSDSLNPDYRPTYRPDDGNRRERASPPVRVVLACPDENRNIGSVCRAMKTMGIRELAIVPCGRDYDASEIAVTAVHAFDVFEHARFFETLPEAFEDCALSVAYTRRQGRNRKISTVSPEEVARRVAQLAAPNVPDKPRHETIEPGHEHRYGDTQSFGGRDGFLTSGTVALVFGNEEGGLTNEQTEACHMACRIPSSPEYPSLNLAQAVQIACYAVFRETLAPNPRGFTPVQAGEIERLTDEVDAIVAQVGYAGSYDRRTSRTFIRDILARSALNPGEARRLQSLLRKIRFGKYGAH